MPTNQSLSRLQRGYAAMQTDTQTPATVAGTNSFYYTKLTLDRVVQEIKRNDITGYCTDALSIKGRVRGTWGLESNLIGSAAGVVPDIDPFLQGTFGQAGTVVATTSVSYAISDNVNSFTLLRYRTPTTITQHMGIGSIVRSAEFNLGADLATFRASGDCVMVIDNDVFSSLTTAEKFGLSAFPTEPGTRTPHSVPTVGFRGSLTLAGQTIATLRNATIRVSTGLELIADTFGSETATGAMRDVRVVTVSFSLYDDDSTTTQLLKTDHWSFTPVAMTAAVGNTAGNTWTFGVNGLLLKDIKYNDSTKRWSIDFGESEAFGTSISSNDALSLQIT